MSYPECYECKKQKEHGGSCDGDFTSSKPCLGYEKDPRGFTQIVDNGEVFIPIGRDIPRLMSWKNDFEYCGSDIMFTKITPIKWDMKNVGIECDCRFKYWSNMVKAEEKEGKIYNIADFKKKGV